MERAREQDMSKLFQVWQDVLDLERLLLENKQIRTRLREERILIATIMAISSDFILFCDNQGRIIRFTQAEQYGCKFEELKGKYIWDSVLSSDNSERAKIFFLQESSTGSLVLRDQFENEWVSPTGETRYISWTFTRFQNENGLPAFAIGIGKDVTEQRIMKKRLRKSKAELNSILENSNGIIYTLSPDGKFMFVSTGWTETLGHDIEEIKGQDIERFFHPDDISMYKEFMHRIMTTGKPEKQVEYRVLHQDGSWHWHSSSGAAVKDEAGNPIYYVGLAVDITEKKQAELALRLSEEKFFKAFRSNPDPITIMTLSEGYYIEVNDAWTEATGYERNETLGRTGSDLGIWLSSDDRSLMIKEIQEQGSLCNYAARFRIKSGEIKDYLISAEIIDMGGNPHLLCVHKDVTESTRAQEALRLSEERFSKAFNASPATMSISTLEEGLYLDVNESFCKIIGYSREEILGRTSLEMGFWVDDNDRKKVVQNILDKEPVRDREIYFRRKFGEQRLGLYSAERLDINGQACLLSIVTDITERKQAEEEIRYLSFYDKLTGLYNRAFFEEELRRLDTARRLPLSLIMGDVNGLKLVNDALGHELGDSLLVMMAGILKKHCRQEDVVARWGGDEFIILLPDCDSLSAARVFNRIKNACKNVNDLPLQTSMSLGMASKNHASQNIREVIREAEDKMYRNKLLESRSMRSTFLVSLEKTLWTRSHETREHCQRMQEIAQKIGKAMGLPDSEMDNLMLLAALHDIGKIAIPNSILEKREELTSEEWDVIKKHPETGYRIALSSPEMAPIAEAILHHHERWDGTGYPLKLKGTRIPLISRIIAIADTYDVMINGRPYQKAASQEEVKREIQKCAGSQFDPRLVKVALEALWPDETARFKIW